jgi:hypothetical protein
LTAALSGAVVQARGDLLQAGGRETAPLAAAIEGLAQVPAFAVMAQASLAARPQWAGLADDLFERPLFRGARANLHNALTATLLGESLYRNVFLSFADALLLWHYGHTQQRTGTQRLDTVYSLSLRLLAAGDRFTEVEAGSEPGAAFFLRLRRVALTQDGAYALLRRAARLLNAVETQITGERLHPLRGSMLTSYASFSAQVIAMARAVREQRDAMTRADVVSGLRALTSLVATPPAALPRR